MATEKKRLGKGLDALLSPTRVRELQTISQAQVIREPEKIMSPPGGVKNKPLSAEAFIGLKSEAAASPATKLKKVEKKSGPPNRTETETGNIKTADGLKTTGKNIIQNTAKSVAEKTVAQPDKLKTPDVKTAQANTLKRGEEKLTIVDGLKSVEKKTAASDGIKSTEKRIETKITDANEIKRIQNTPVKIPMTGGEKKIFNNIIPKTMDHRLVSGGTGINNVGAAGPKETNNSMERTAAADRQGSVTGTSENIGQALEIPLSKIVKNPHQPRQQWDESKLVELADSIRANGLIQPVIVRKMGSVYQLIAGERRLRASVFAGKATIPAIVKDATEEQAVEWSLIENIHREDLNPIERARAYQHYMNQFHLTQEEAAERLGDRRSTVANFVRMLELSAGVQELILTGQLTTGHAKALLGVAGSRAREDLGKVAAMQRWSVRELERRIQRMGRSDEIGAARDVAGQKKATAVEANIRELEGLLSRSLMLRVTIHTVGRSGQRGRVQIEYNSLDDFERLQEKLTRE
jgi:ParB family transcriptional regulator, chromosome partitioning protein